MTALALLSSRFDDSSPSSGSGSGGYQCTPQGKLVTSTSPVATSSSLGSLSTIAMQSPSTSTSPLSSLSTPTTLSSLSSSSSPSSSSLTTSRTPSWDQLLRDGTNRRVLELRLAKSTNEFLRAKERVYQRQLKELQDTLDRRASTIVAFEQELKRRYFRGLNKSDIGASLFDAIRERFPQDLTDVAERDRIRNEFLIPLRRRITALGQWIRNRESKTTSPFTLTTPPRRSTRKRKPVLAVKKEEKEEKDDEATTTSDDEDEGDEEDKEGGSVSPTSGASKRATKRRVVIAPTTATPTTSRGVESVDAGFEAFWHEVDDIEERFTGRKEALEVVAQFILAFAHDWRVWNDAFFNFAILGPVGVGKTVLAQVIFNLFRNLGIFLTNQFTVVSRSEMVAGFLGQTAAKTQQLLINHLEGALFIDEAYSLAERDPRTGSFDEYGQEAITTLVNFLDKHKSQIMVIVAGYPQQMLCDFFNANPGLRRRFPFMISLPKYTPDELVQIFERRTLNNGVTAVSDEAKALLKSYLSDPGFADALFHFNAGDMENLATRATIYANVVHGTNVVDDEIIISACDMYSILVQFARYSKLLTLQNADMERRCTRGQGSTTTASSSSPSKQTYSRGGNLSTAITTTTSTNIGSRSSSLANVPLSTNTSSISSSSSLSSLQPLFPLRSTAFSRFTGQY